MLPFYAHIFRAEGYGVIGMIDASLGVLSIIFAGGFHVAILRIYHEESGERKGRVLSTAIRLILGGGIPAILIPMAFSSQLSRTLLGSEQFTSLFVLSLITFLIDVVGLSASTAVIIKQQSILYSAMNLARLVVGLAMNIWLVLIVKVGLIGVFVSSLVTALMASTLYLFMAVREHGFAYDKQIAKKLLKFQLPLLPGDVISFMSRQAERYLLRFIVDIRAVGILEMSYKFPPLLNLFVSIPFTQAWRTKSIEIAEKGRAAPLVIGRMFTNYFFVMVFAGLVLAVGIEELLEIATPPEFWQAARIAKIEIVTTILASANGLLLFGLIYRKKTSTISAVKVSMAVLKIPLAFLMIVEFQLKGAAYSALVVETITTFAVWHRSQKHYRIEYEYTKLLLIAGYGLLTYLLIANYGIAQMFDLSSLKQAMRGLAIDVIGRSPLSDRTSAKLLETVLDKQDALISLIMDILSSLVFLIAAPLLVLPRRVREVQIPGKDALDVRSHP
jgi:O-antigen/teichoic acid export membrane protein